MHGALDGATHAFGPRVAELAGRLPALRATTFYDEPRPEDAGPGPRPGRVTPDWLRRQHPDWRRPTTSCAARSPSCATWSAGWPQPASLQAASTTSSSARRTSCWPPEPARGKQAGRHPVARAAGLLHPRHHDRTRPLCRASCPDRRRPGGIAARPAGRGLRPRADGAAARCQPWRHGDQWRAGGGEAGQAGPAEAGRGAGREARGAARGRERRPGRPRLRQPAAAAKACCAPSCR